MDHVPRVVVVEFKDIPGIKLQWKVMVDHVQDQMKNIIIVISKNALVSLSFSIIVSNHVDKRLRNSKLKSRILF